MLKINEIAIESSRRREGILNNSMNRVGKALLNAVSRSKVASIVATFVVAVLVFSVAAQAQKPVEQKVSFYLDGKIGADVVKKGTYTVVIPEADQGQMEIKVGKKTITAPFTKRQNKEEADADKMTYRDNGDGTRAIATITPRGHKFTLLLEDSVASK
jgi:phosphate-selective porin